MKKNKSIIIFLILIPGFAGTLIEEKAPIDIEDLFNSFFREYIELSPESGSALGITEEHGVKVQNNKLDDESVEALDRLYETYRKYNRWLSQYNKEELTTSQIINRDILKWFLQNELKGEKFKHHRYIINPMLSFHSQLTTLMTEHHKIETPLDAKNYLERLIKYEGKISELIERLKIQEQKGILPPSYVLETFTDELTNFIELPVKENVIFTSFKIRVENLSDFDDGTKEELCKSVIDAIENVVYPSYKEMIKYLNSIREKTDRYAGVWKLPSGYEYYEYCLHGHTTATLHPEEIH
jgi:uncharacterized protein (DUF885 family)